MAGESSRTFVYSTIELSLNHHTREELLHQSEQKLKTKDRKYFTYEFLYACLQIYNLGRVNIGQSCTHEWESSFSFGFSIQRLVGWYYKWA